jgi:LPXTG-site transpeptidase (sortase) family protein
MSGTGPPPVHAPEVPPRLPSAGSFVAGAGLSILAVLLLGFVAHLGFLSSLRHDRDQVIGYAQLRSQLANATAPVGPVDDAGRLIAPGTPVAVITIPALKLREVIREGTTSGTLASGPGHRRDTVLPGQVGTSVIFGRHSAYGGPFHDIRKLKPGDELHVTTGQGEHTYRVLGVRRAGDPQPAPLGKGGSRLTLVTATGAAFLPSGVLRVDAELTSQAQPAPQQALTAGSLPGAEVPLAGDPAAWTPLFLWGELLLVCGVGVVWARSRWGRWQAWVVGVPLLGALGLAIADQVARLLPNLM